MSTGANVSDELALQVVKAPVVVKAIVIKIEREGYCDTEVI